MLHYGEVRQWPTWAEILSQLNHFLLGINSSSNIIIYVAKVGETLYIHQTSFHIFKDFKFRRALFLSLTCREEENNRRQSRRRTSVTMITFNTGPPLGVRREDSLTTSDQEQVM
jgi:hypothetical protein